MKIGMRWTAIALVAFGFGALALMGGGWEVALVLIGLPALVAVLVMAGRRPARAALVLAVIIVAGGTLVTTVRVIDRVADGRVEYRGTVDGRELHRVMNPSAEGMRREAQTRARMGTVSSADVTMSVPRAGAELTVLWVISELAPWALAAYVLSLLAPLLRGAERDDPFWEDAATYLTEIGGFLLVGIPAIAIFRFIVANQATTEVAFAAPIAEPQLSLNPWSILPGVLVLAGVFRRGAALRDLERRTI